MANSYVLHIASGSVPCLSHLVVFYYSSPNIFHYLLHQLFTNDTITCGNLKSLEKRKKSSLARRLISVSSSSKAVLSLSPASETSPIEELEVAAYELDVIAAKQRMISCNNSQPASAKHI
jgi:hypothetical protein